MPIPGEQMALKLFAKNLARKLAQGAVAVGKSPKAHAILSKIARGGR